MNYLGRLHGYYGQSADEDMHIDVMIGGIEDLKGKWRARFYGKDKSAADIAAALPLWREEVPTWLGFLETVKATHGGQYAHQLTTVGGPLRKSSGLSLSKTHSPDKRSCGVLRRWMVGDRITLADFYAFEALDGAMRTDPTILAEHPGLLGFVADFARRPNIRRYIEDDGRETRFPHTGGPDTPEAEGAGANYLDAIFAQKTEL